MAQTDVILKGEDRQIDFVFTKADATALNLTTDITNLVIWLYASEREKIVLAKYAISAVAEHSITDLVVTDAAAGELYIKLQADKTRLARLGNLYCEVKVRFANVDYSNNTFDSILNDYVIAQVKDSLTGSLDTL